MKPAKEVASQLQELNYSSADAAPTELTTPSR